MINKGLLFFRAVWTGMPFRWNVDPSPAGGYLALKTKPGLLTQSWIFIFLLLINASI